MSHQVSGLNALNFGTLFRILGYTSFHVKLRRHFFELRSTCSCASVANKRTDFYDTQPDNLQTVSSYLLTIVQFGTCDMSTVDRETCVKHWIQKVWLWYHMDKLISLLIYNGTASPMQVEPWIRWVTIDEITSNKATFFYKIIVHKNMRVFSLNKILIDTNKNAPVTTVERPKR